MESYALEDEAPSFHLMTLVSKTDDTLVFEATETHTYTVVHQYNVFASPISKPRLILSHG